MTVICYGDSNTYGYDPRDFWTGRYDSSERWVDVLAEKTGWNIINQGQNGREVPVREVSFPLETDLLVLMLGTNDLLHFRPPEEIAKRMEAFLLTAGVSKEKILLVAPPPMVLGEWVPNRECIKDSVILAENYRVLAQRLCIPFADAGQWTIPMLFDGVHFAPEGHKAFAEGIYNRIKLLQTR